MPDTATASYREAWREREQSVVAEVFRPRSRLRVSEWAERKRILTKGPMASQLWRNEEAPYLVEVMDTLSDPERPRKAVVIKSSRVGYTEGVIGNGVGFFIDQAPTDVIVMQPTDDEADAYSVEHLDPMFRRTPALRDRLRLDAYKDSRNRIAYKAFANGSLALIGPKGSSLRRRSARVAFSDEIDELGDVHDQGDPLARLEKRLDDFDDSIHFMGSTPTNEGMSRIDREWRGSDMRRWFVRCPHCDLEQSLEWGGKESEHGIKWDREVFCRTCGVEVGSDGESCSDCGSEQFEIRHLPETAHYACKGGCRIEESDKRSMIQGGAWLATNPRGRYPGWHIHALVSLFAGARWAKLVDEFLEAKDDPEKLKVFVNTVLGEVWDERGKKTVSVSELEARAVLYVSANGERIEVPDGVGVLTAGVDVQGDRLELLVRGYGADEESWDILHQRIFGDPEQTLTWSRLEHFLTRRYRMAHGAELGILATMIDSGFKPKEVYDFVRPREVRNVWASRGDKGAEGAPPLKRPVKSNSDGVSVWTIGTFTMKDALYGRLAVRIPGKRYVHLRAADPEFCNGFDSEYFAQFGGEKKVRRRIKGTLRWKNQWVKTRARNEAPDLHVLCDSALRSLGPGVHDEMAKWVGGAREGRSQLGTRKRRGRRVRSRGVA